MGRRDPDTQADSPPDDETPPPTRSADDRPAVGATERVRVRGTGTTREVVARSDTGAARTSIDAELAADVGAGPVTDVSEVTSATRPSGQARPVVEVTVGIGPRWHAVQASVADRRHLEYAMLLGRDVLEGYRVDVRRRARPDEEAP